MAKQLNLKWNNHTSNLLEIFENLLSTELFVDVTLACEGLSLKAHKIVLCASSPFFKSLFSENPSKHPIVILKDIKYCDLQAVIKFIYSGEVNVSQDQLLSFLLTAETLKVKGLEKITARNRQALGLEKKRNIEQSTVTTPISPPITKSSENTTKSPLQHKRQKGRSKRPLMDLCLSDDEGIVTKSIGRETTDVEELLGSGMVDITSDMHSGSGPSSLFMVSLHSSGKVKNSPKKSRPLISRNSKVTDAVNEMEVEPSNLLEQTLIVENDSFVNQNNTDHTQHSCISSLETSGESIIISDIPSQTIVSTPDSNLLTPDSPLDIKPEIIPNDDLPVSPVPGPSRSSVTSLMQTDQSDISLTSQSKFSNVAKYKSVAKRKITRRKKKSKGNSTVEKEPWKQVLHMCSDCSYINANIEELISHIEFHKKSATQCDYCNIDFTELCKPELTPAVQRSIVDCDICDHCFCSKTALLNHKQLHHY